MLDLRLAPKTADGRPRIAVEKPDSSKVTLYSHDWTNPTTWYEESTRVVEETATDGGDQLTYSLANVNVIDTYHGFITQEDFLVDASDNSYRAVVTVNDVAKTEQDPHVGSGGDYTINYSAGTVTFLSALSGSDVVKVTYHYAGSSLVTIKPAAGTDLLIDFVEVQFSADVGLTDNVTFQARGFVDVFAPQLTPDPYPPGTLIPLKNPLIYKGMRDFLNDGVRAFPKYPAGLGGASWRGLPSDIYIFDWDYVRSTRLHSEYGMEVQVCLQHNVPFTGSYATASFYCSSEPNE